MTEFTFLGELTVSSRLLPPDSRLWFSNEMQNLLLSEKRTLYLWATFQLFFSLAQVRCFWWCFGFRSGLSPFSWRCLSVVTLDSLTPASVHSLWSSPNRLCLTVFSSLQSSLLLEHIFLSNFFLPVNFAFNILWYSTPWTAPTFNNDPLWRRCQWSSSGPLPSQQSYPLLWFQRTRDTQNLYCMDGHLLKLKCKYSNILRYWIFDFHEM